MSVLLAISLGWWWCAAEDREASLELVAPADVVAGREFAVVLRAVREPATLDQREPLPSLLALACDDPRAELPPPAAPAVALGRRELAVTLHTPGTHRVRCATANGEIASNAIRCHSELPAQRLLFGDLHVHEARIAHHMDRFADARVHALALEQEYAYARDIGCLDFVALTPHHQIGGGLVRPLAGGGTLWQQALGLGERAAQSGLVVLPAYELQTAEGDHNVYFRSLQQAPITVPSALVADLALPPPAQALVNPHPIYLPDPWFYPSRHERLVEVLRDVNNHEPWVTRALEDGWQLGFVGGSDNHRGAAGSQSLTAVVARDRTADAVFDALYERRTYATNGARIVLDFTVNGAPMGAMITTAAPPSIAVKVAATSVPYRVEILRNRDVIAARTFTLADAELELVDQDFALAATDNTYYRVRVAQDARTRGPQGGQWPNQQALSSPIWVKPDAAVAADWAAQFFAAPDAARVTAALGTWYQALLATRLDPDRCLAAQRLARFAWDMDDGDARQVLAMVDGEHRVQYAGFDAVLSELPEPQFAPGAADVEQAIAAALSACDRAAQGLATIASARQPQLADVLRRRARQVRALLSFVQGYGSGYRAYQRSLAAWLAGDDALATRAAAAAAAQLDALTAQIVDLEADGEVRLPLDLWRIASVRVEARALLDRARSDLARTWVDGRFARAVMIGRDQETAAGLRRLAEGVFDLNASYFASALPRTARTAANETELLANCGFEPWREPASWCATATAFPAATTPILVRIKTEQSAAALELHYARGPDAPGVVPLVANDQRVALAALADFAPASPGQPDFTLPSATPVELAVFAPRSSGRFARGWVSELAATPSEISFTVSDDTDVELRVFDARGALAVAVVSAHVAAGVHRQAWQPPASGSYRCELRAALGGYDVARVVDTKLPVRANSFEPAIALEPGTLNIALLTSSLNRFTAAGEGIVQGPVLEDALLEAGVKVDAFAALAGGSSWASFSCGRRLAFAPDGRSGETSEDHSPAPCRRPIGMDTFVAQDELGNLYTLPPPRSRPTFAMSQILRKRTAAGDLIGTFRVDVPVAGRPDPKPSRTAQAFAVRQDGSIVFPCGRPFQFPREWRANGMDLAFLEPRYEQVLSCEVKVP